MLTAKNEKGMSTSSSTTSSDVDEYRNPATAFLSNFMQQQTPTKAPESSITTVAQDDDTSTDPLANINFQSPKLQTNINIETLAKILDAELIDKEWFVTGKVNPVYFDEGFQFQDPDVKLTGVEGVCVCLLLFSLFLLLLLQ